MAHSCVSRPALACAVAYRDARMLSKCVNVFPSGNVAACLGLALSVVSHGSILLITILAFRGSHVDDRLARRRKINAGGAAALDPAAAVAVRTSRSLDDRLRR